MKPQILSEMLRTIKRDNPAASEKEISDLCREKVRIDAELQDALFDYWFANSVGDFNVLQLRPGETVIQRNTRSRLSPESAARKSELVAKVKGSIVARLMEFALSDGTQLRHATFGQCKREGNWLSEVGGRGKANEIVGKKLTEADLQNLMKRFTSKKRAA